MSQTLSQKSEKQSKSKKSNLSEAKTKEEDEEEEEEVQEEDQWKSRQQPVLLELISSELKCSAEDIVDFELSM